MVTNPQDIAGVQFLDSNILLRHLTQDHAGQSPRASAYLARIERDEVRVLTSDIVLFEVVYTLQRYYRQPRAAIRDRLLPLIELPGIILSGKRKYRQVFNLYVDLNISFADAYHAVLMVQLHLTEVLSFDQDFDRITGINRVEP